ncbi:MAG: L,D-transpeptidase [Hyphomicrobiales bacterium]|jgi:lipoprotein-anchoring transpeptidase ErfK/SrfK
MNAFTNQAERLASSIKRPTRRQFLAGAAAMSGLAVSGCMTNTVPQRTLVPNVNVAPSPYLSMYAALPQEQFPIPAVDLTQVPEQYLRRMVDFNTTENVGTVIVDTNNFYLYHVMENGKAMRYGVGLGRAGFEWSGRARIAWKRAWPRWTPPDEMVARQPELEPYSIANGGMDPGLENPLGARALYIFQGNVDTLYRLHGTNEVWSIGKAVSSGCVRLLNQDVIHLYGRVANGSAILVA